MRLKGNCVVLFITALFFLIAGTPLQAAEITLKSGHDMLSIKNELKRTYQMGYDYLQNAPEP